MVKIYTHCSALILIAEFKLKMARSYCTYDEEWQRRKSVLIRSLFHDIPILSPVEEDSNDSSLLDDDGIRYEDFGNCRTNENKEPRTERMDDGAITEREESHHSTADQNTTESEEPDKIGIEEIYEAEGSDNEIIDNHEIIEETSQTRQTNTSVIVDLEVKTGEESHSIIDDQEMTKSDRSNTKEYNVINADRNTNYQESKREEFTRTYSERRNELIASNDELMEADVESSQSSEGPYYRQKTTEALIHFDGPQVPGDRESIVYEGSVKSIILPTRYRRVLASRNVNVEDRIEVYEVLEENADPKIATTFDIDEHETTDEDLEEVTTSHPDTTFENDEEDDEVMSGPQSDASDRNVEAIGETEAIKENDEEMDARQSNHSEEIDTNLPDATNKEIEERGNIDPDGTDEENEAWRPNDAGEHIGEMRTKTSESTMIEMKIHQPAATDDEEGTESPHSIEQIRTPRPDLSHGSIPVSHRSKSASSTEHTALPQELSGLTASIQDGGDNNMSELQTSNDMNEVLASIFNDSRNKDMTPISGKKRKLVDKSVQAAETSRVTWEEMRANFFVGTPKIFRLCACTDHICP